MRSDGRKLIKKTDLLPLLIIVSVTFLLLFAFSGEKPGYAEIYHNGELIRTCSLDDNGDIYVCGGNVRLTVSDGGIFVSESSCPDKTCVRTGRIHTGYQSIVCLPNKLLVKISDDNTNSNDIDVIM